MYTYLNTAAASAPPQPVIEAMVEYLQKTATVGPYLPSFRKEVYAKVDQIRDQAARFIGAEREEIAFTKNGTEAINFIANGIDWNAGDEVILADLEFHSNYVPWLKLEAEGKIRLKVLKTDASGVISLRELEKLITRHTRFITVSHLPNASGALQPVQEICSLARKYGILTLVNASQTLGLVPINVQELSCDFLAACGRKWLRGPEGSGILYVRGDRIEALKPTLVGWGGTLWDFETNEFSFLRTARRVEAGCPVIPSILGFGAAIEYAQHIGVETIYTRVKGLTEYAVERMKTIPGISIYGPGDVRQRLGIIPFNVEGLSPDRITEFLEENEMVIEAGTFMANTLLQQYGIERMARLSPHYFNTIDEIDRFVEAVKKLKGEIPGWNI